jgi:NodT family efflux transporter outer membrane factor (OMF) lipoprotein
MTYHRFVACLPILLTACASAPPTQVSAALPAAWAAELPHGGSVTELSRWWQQQGDALLADLITAAESASPGIAAAESRIANAHAARVASGAALGPTLDANVAVTRASQQSTLPLGTTTQGVLQASWEIDLFGARRAGRDAAQARYEGAQAGWHEARVSVAAETANLYYSLRACEKQLSVARADAASREQTAVLTEIGERAGLQSHANASLARASAAEGSGRATLQQSTCDIDVKALVAMTALSEADLRARLRRNAGDLPQSTEMTIAVLPAATLAQRPDVFNAEREVAAASADVGAAQADRYPRLGLSGQIGAASFRSEGVTTNLDVWTIGPLSLTLPLFDGGRRSANVDAAQVRYKEAEIKYRATVRQAVREVEEALVRLDASGRRSGDAVTAARGYYAAFDAALSRYRNGMASLVELEDARRTRLAAESALIDLQRERASAWVGLYRAAGGGWRRPDVTTR